MDREKRTRTHKEKQTRHQKTRKWEANNKENRKGQNSSLSCRVDVILLTQKKKKMTIRFIILQNRQGKTRLTKWYVPDYNQKEKQRILREVGHMVTTRDKHKCNFIPWREHLIVYKRYASLYFVMCIEETDNEILMMELIHQFVEVLDSYFGNVCELDLIFNFDKAHYILDELILGGSIQETSKREIIRMVKQQDEMEQKIKDERKGSGKKKQYLKEIFH